MDMRYLILLLLIFLVSCQEPEHKLFILEVKYENQHTDTLRIISEEDSKFYLKKYQESNSLKCNKIRHPVAYFVFEFKLLNH